MRPWSNLEPALRRQLHALICFAIYYGLSKYATPMSMIAPENLNQSFWWTMVLVCIASNKIFLLWGMFISHESCLIASGIGFRARKDKIPEDYNIIRSMDVIKFTCSSSVKETIASWNMRTNHWLKYYVMTRNMDRTLPRKVNQVWPKVWAFILSDIFHGYYIGYSLFFLGLFLIDMSKASL